MYTSQTNELQAGNTKEKSNASDKLCFVVRIAIRILHEELHFAPTNWSLVSSCNQGTMHSGLTLHVRIDASFDANDNLILSICDELNFISLVSWINSIVVNVLLHKRDNCPKDRCTVQRYRFVVLASFVFTLWKP